MTAPESFAAFILTHGRAGRVVTIKALRKHGYTGPIHLVVDDTDKDLADYYQEEDVAGVHVFSKAEWADKFDVADTTNDMRAVVYARNATFPIVKGLGYQHFVMLDDDYDWFGFRFLRLDQSAGSTPVADLDGLFTAMVDLLEETGAATVAMSQGGDHIGGGAGPISKGKVLRKAMNSFIFNTDRPITFVGRINEDTNTYVIEGTRGVLFFTSLGIQLHQARTQAEAGGLTDIYLALGTYVKSFYSVLMAPSCVKIGRMGDAQPRYHHQVAWDNAVPKIISDRYRKP